MAVTKRRKPTNEIDAAGRVLRAVRKAERQAGDGADIGGTGFTILKLRQPPIARLIDQSKIGAEEIQAADEIAMAFFAIDTRGRLHGMTLERVDKSGSSADFWPARTAKAVGNYQSWASHWSTRNKAYSDPMLEVVVSAVIDERPVRQIGAEINRHHSKVERGLICGLRDYAARAGFVAGGMANRWIRDAEGVFVAGNTRLADAVRRAKIER